MVEEPDPRLFVPTVASLRHALAVAQLAWGPLADRFGRKPIFYVGTVIYVIGNQPNPLVSQTSPEIETSRWGTINTDPVSMMTSMPGVFAGGDIVSGAATVISAMGQGKTAALHMHRYLMG